MARRCLALLLVSCLVVSAFANESSVLESILKAPEFSGFVHLLEYADLVSSLRHEIEKNKGEGVTLLVPTDESLTSFNSLTMLAYLKSPQNIELLRKVLLHHVMPQRVSVWTWKGVHKTLEGSPLRLYVEGLTFHAGGIPIKQIGTVVAEDGLVHAVDGLIVPESVLVGLRTMENSASSRRELESVGPSAGPSASPASAPSSSSSTPTSSPSTTTSGSSSSSYSPPPGSSYPPPSTAGPPPPKSTSTTTSTPSSADRVNTLGWTLAGILTASLSLLFAL